MSERKTEFWWASIHGADPEPVEKTEHDSRPCVYTLGCADPFYLDEAECAVVFIPPSDGDHLIKMYRPAHPNKSLAERAAIAAERAATPKRAPHYQDRRWHGWRGPR